MTKILSVRPDAVVSALGGAGYSVDHQTGSHVILYKEGRLPISVPRHNRDLKKGTLHQILRSAGIGPEEFVKLLKG